MTHAQLSKLPVQTESGKELGRIHDVMYDIDGFGIVQIMVTGGMIKRSEYTIHIEQIVQITAAHIVVRDAVLGAISERTKPLPQGASPAMMRESN